MKSQLSDPNLEVMQAIYKDACVKCAAKVSLRDLKTLRSRFRDEGMSFLTITLPEFSRDFERCLELGYVDPQLFRRFGKSGKCPQFLGGIFGRIFNRETGRINDYDTGFPPGRSPVNFADLIGSIRQICRAFQKIKLACTPKRERSALEAFIAIEHEFNVFPLPKSKDERFKLVSRMLWDNLLYPIRISSLIPRHGPGQTAERISGNRKYSWQFWHHRLEPYFPILDSAFSTSCGEIGFESEELKRVTMLHSEQEPPSRVVTVPKTLKRPRTIAIEPCCNQYTQQAISRELIHLLETSKRTSGHINFRDQSINSSLALESSSSGRLATIDLSDASDRVPVGYALYMLRGNPDLKDSVEASRSRWAQLPDGRKVYLRKFASMGSALCFPIEAMYFYTICIVALLESQNLPVSHANIDLVSRDVYVYGDDLLVPVIHAASVLDHLKEYNCKVNERKTFYLGKFRESCGVDAYDGHQVTPVYVNRVRPRNRQQVKEILSWLAASNHFYNRGYMQTASYMFNAVRRVVGKLPAVPENSPVLGHPFGCTYSPPKKWRRKFQRSEVLCWIQSPVYRTDKLDGYAALQKSLLRLEGLRNLLAQRDRFHLERSALHGEVAINRRWVPEHYTGYRQ